MIQEGDCIKSRFTDDLTSFIKIWGDQFGKVIHITDKNIIIYTDKSITLPKEEFYKNWVID